MTDRFAWEPGDIQIVEPGLPDDSPTSLADLRASFGNDDNRLAQFMATNPALPEVVRQQANAHLFHGAIMKVAVVKQNSDDLERLSALEHAQWVTWSKTLADRGDVDAGLIARWKPNWVPYHDLTETAKEQDRIWARRALAAISKSDEGSATAIAARDRIESEIAKYREDQARDEQGRWTTEGGGETSTTGKPSYPKDIPHISPAESKAIDRALKQPWKVGGEYKLPSVTQPHDQVKVATPDTPEFTALTQGVVDRAKAEEPAITASVQAIATATGGMTVGLEHRLKTDESVARKIFTDEKNVGYPAAAARIADAVRYTVVYPDKTYTESTQKALGELRTQFTAAKVGPDGKPMEGKNYWNPKTAPDGKNPEYMGINTWWKTPSGQQFEVQFHTPRSVLTKEIASHPIYEAQRVPAVPASRLGVLTGALQNLWRDADHMPPGVLMMSL